MKEIELGGWNVEQLLKFMTQEDQDKVNKFLTSFSIPFFRQYLPDSSPAPPLYHYTIGDNLIRIIESQELWATQAACLNDTTELTYAADQLRLAVMRKNLSATGYKDRYLPLATC